MSKLKRKIIENVIAWLDRMNSNKYLNISLMVIIIASVSVFFGTTWPESVSRVHILIVPVIAGADIYFLGSKNHVLKETANFIAGILSVAFLFFALSLIFMGLVIFKSL